MPLRQSRKGSKDDKGIGGGGSHGDESRTSRSGIRKIESESESRSSRDERQAETAPRTARPSGKQFSRPRLRHRVSPTPNTPADVQEAYKSATTATYPETPGEHRPSISLSEADLKHIFSGAPHFLLERGRRTQLYPHVIFPWDESHAIQNLRDRQPLKHSSYTLATLHAHLPVSSGSSGIQIYPDNLAEKRGSKRPSFDIGVFEIPNMLSYIAKEPGCVGFRYYMELPVGDAVLNKPLLPSRKWTEGEIPLEGIRNQPYSECSPDIVHDRLELIKGGPAAWKRIGLRDCSVKDIAERLGTLARIRDEILQGKPITILDIETMPNLYHNLFHTFLYPPAKSPPKDDLSSLKAQIHALEQVLTTKGAWIDFSLVEWRIWIGQLLWEMPPHPSSDDMNPASTESSFDPSLERKWLLLQLTLSAEMILRIDTAVKIGVIGRSSNIPITTQDIYQIIGMRTAPGDWSIVTCRRLLENMTIEYHPQLPVEIGRTESPSKSKTERIRARLGALRHSRKQSLDTSVWDCVLLPCSPRRQLEGLIVFAENLNWPEIDRFRSKMTTKMLSALSDRPTMLQVFASPVQAGPLPSNVRPLKKNDMYRTSHTSQLIQLHTPKNVEERLIPDLGGWLSRTWWSALVLPGEAISHLIICTLIENDLDAMNRIGPIANLHGGFVYKGTSWWSKVCILGRVLNALPGSGHCLGWISSSVAPVDVTGNPLGDGWLEIITMEGKHMKGKPRINEGTRVFLDSSPLGTEGNLSSSAFCLPVDAALKSLGDRAAVIFEKVTLATEDFPIDSGRPLKARASVTFTVHDPSSAPQSPQVVIFPITHDVQFISSYTCLPPYGRISHGSKNLPRDTHPSQPHSHHYEVDPMVFDKSDDSYHSSREGDPHSSKQQLALRLPGHPLHADSFPYSYIPFSALPTMTSLSTLTLPVHLPPAPTNYLSLATQRGLEYMHLHPRKHTYIIDACGSKDREAFARAWCAAVGTDAVVGRVGRTCLACCIRQARAVDVDVVIRVGMSRVVCSDESESGGE
ncbi:hypothetical protein AJ80_06130 [Polytolypa hystricis UAMH7299]|uniref:Uncharacterized protein n=1 Tax=Polytolypa hystricis (strain UAMH7299) TaxID=1447883 RepID=A0A2B7XY85_POLH7|nr:hypothetical protein AJ80_06130 [Polytolypa hystricis UAMH7299]